MHVPEPICAGFSTTFIGTCLFCTVSQVTQLKGEKTSIHQQVIALQQPGTFCMT